MRKRSEFDVQKTLCQYAKLKYPNLLWRSDMSGITLGKKVAIQYWTHLAKYRGFPDWVCYEPMPQCDFVGLQLELKIEGFDIATIIEKKLHLSSSAHISEQWTMIQSLRERGWAAGFVVGSKSACSALDAYLDADIKKLNQFIYPPIPIL